MARKPKKKSQEIQPQDILKDIQQEVDSLVTANKLFSNESGYKGEDIWESNNILSFEDFCKSPDFMNFPSISPRQKMVVDYLIGNDYRKIFENNRTTAVLIWGKGCFIGDEELYVVGDRITFKESYEKNIPLITYSYKIASNSIVQTLSTPAIKKPDKEVCYMVIFDNGIVCNVSEDHQFLTDKGFKKLKDIQDDDFIIFKGGFPLNLTIYDNPPHEAYLMGLIACNQDLYIKNIAIADKILYLNNKHNLGIELFRSGTKLKIYFNDKSLSDKYEANKQRIPKRILFSPQIFDFLKGFFEYGYEHQISYQMFKDLFYVLMAYGIMPRYKRGKLIIYREDQKKINKLLHNDIYWDTNVTYKCKIVSRKNIGKHDVYTLTVPSFHNYWNVGCIHHNSGKDTISALIQLYLVYVLLNMKSPQAYFGLSQASTIDLLNIASTREQAEQVYFQLLKNFVLNWKWLKSKYQYVVSGRYFSSPSSDLLDSTENVIITTEAILFPKNIRMFSGSSEADSSEGKNLLCFVLDEADAFKIPSRSAEQIYRVCRTSAVSRFQNKYKAFILSYPRSSDGFIFNLYRKVEDNISFYCDIAATWEVLPSSKFSNEYFEFEGEKIPIEFFDDFRLDPVGAKLTYMCRPQGIVENRYIDIQEIQYSFIERPRAEFVFKDYIYEDNNAKYVRKDLIYIPYDKLFKEYPYVLSFDLAVVQDRCALCLLHLEKDQVVMDFITAWVPNKQQNVIVDLDNVYKIVTDIAKIVKPVKIVGDYWNSALLCQKLTSDGFQAEIMKVTNEDYIMLKRLFINRTLYLVKNDMLIDEIQNLIYKKNTIDHPKQGHDDLFMAMLIGVKALLSLKADKGVNLVAEGQFITRNIGSENLFKIKEYDPFADGAIIIDKNWILKPK